MQTWEETAGLYYQEHVNIVSAFLYKDHIRLLQHCFDTRMKHKKIDGDKRQRGDVSQSPCHIWQLFVWLNIQQHLPECDQLRFMKGHNK